MRYILAWILGNLINYFLYFVGDMNNTTSLSKVYSWNLTLIVAAVWTVIVVIAYFFLEVKGKKGAQ